MPPGICLNIKCWMIYVLFNSISSWFHKPAQHDAWGSIEHVTRMPRPEFSYTGVREVRKSLKAAIAGLSCRKSLLPNINLLNENNIQNLRSMMALKTSSTSMFIERQLKTESETHYLMRTGCTEKANTNVNKHKRLIITRTPIWICMVLQRKIETELCNGSCNETLLQSRLRSARPSPSWATMQLSVMTTSTCRQQQVINGMQNRACLSDTHTRLKPMQWSCLVFCLMRHTS